MGDSLATYEREFYEATGAESINDAKRREFLALGYESEFEFYKHYYDLGKTSGDIDDFLV